MFERSSFTTNPITPQTTRPLTLDKKIAQACAGRGSAFREITSLTAAMNRLAVPSITLSYCAIRAGALFLGYSFAWAIGSLPLAFFTSSLILAQLAVTLPKHILAETRLKDEIQNIVTQAIQEYNAYQIAFEQAKKEIALLTEQKNNLLSSNATVEQQSTFTQRRAAIVEEAKANISIGTMNSLLDEEIIAAVKETDFTAVDNLPSAIAHIVKPTLTLSQLLALIGTAIVGECLMNLSRETGPNATALGILNILTKTMGVGFIIAVLHHVAGNNKQKLIRHITEAYTNKEHKHPPQPIQPLLYQITALEHTIRTLQSLEAESNRTAA